MSIYLRPVTSGRRCTRSKCQERAVLEYGHVVVGADGARTERYEAMYCEACWQWFCQGVAKMGRLFGHLIRGQAALMEIP